MKNVKSLYYLIITILFVYIFVQFLSLKNTNIIYKFYNDYIMDKYCLIIYICLLFYIMQYDTYTAVLLFVLIIGPFRCSKKEYFENEATRAYTTSPYTTSPYTTSTYTTSPYTTRPYTTSPYTTNPYTTSPNTTSPNTTNPYTTSPNTTSPNTTNPNTISNLDREQNEINKTVKDRLLGVDDRFKMDDIKKNEILRQIKAQINFDPYKTELSKDVIYEIYNKYFDNNVFLKLQSIDEDSKNYIASGNFTYIPQNKKVDFDIKTYQDLNKNNTAFGINAELSKNGLSTN